jgi:hypothetical protein
LQIDLRVFDKKRKRKGKEEEKTGKRGGKEKVNKKQILRFSSSSFPFLFPIST